MVIASVKQEMGYGCVYQIFTGNYTGPASMILVARTSKTCQTSGLLAKLKGAMA